MNVKITLEPGETMGQAEERLEKALKRKHECSNNERYCDPALNQFHDYVTDYHKRLVTGVIEELKAELIRDIHSRDY